MNYIKLTVIAGCFLALQMNSFLFAQAKSYKRGVSYEIPYAEDVYSLSKGSSWFYNWGVTPNAVVDAVLEDEAVDFVPMAWNGGYNENALRSYLQTHKNVKYLLGFNEPNFKSQANMTPAEAVAAWPRLQKIADDFGLKIVAPAVNFSPDAPYQDPNAWLDEFFKLLPADARVDYVAVHCYIPYTSALMWYISKFKKYGKPIWLTEFCAWDEFYNIPGDQPSNQMKFMVNAINYLESDPDVYRYAWFIPRTGGNDKYPYMQFLEDNAPGALTDLGQVFVNMSSQDKSYYFKVGEQIPAEHYSSMNIVDIDNSDNWKDGFQLRLSTDDNGILEIYDFNDNEWAEYNIDVPSSGDFQIKLRYASKEDASCQLSVGGTELSVLSMPSTGGEKVWKEYQATLNLQKGEQTLRLKVTNGTISLNWLTLLSGSSTHNDLLEMASTVSVYPSPVKDIMSIRSGDRRVNNLKIYELSGRMLAELKIESNDVNLSFLPAGTYFLNIEMEDGISCVKKIVKY